MTHLPAMARLAFSRMDPGFADRARAAGCGVVVAGHNYGQGSSRENAATMLRQLGVRAVLARSYARIHRSNLINWGVLPLILDPDLPGDALPALGDRLEFRSWRERLAAAAPGEPLAVRNVTRGSDIHVHHDLTPEELEIVLAGGLFPRLRDRCRAGGGQPDRPDGGDAGRTGRQQPREEAG